MRIITKIIICFLLFACNQEKKESEVNSSKLEQNNKEIFKSQFIVEMEVIINNDEEFEMFYQDYNHHKYTWKSKIKKKIKGSDRPQTITFKIPEDYFPNSLRFDFGKNPDTRNIQFISLKMTYEDFILKMNPAEFAAFFVPNNYITYNKDNGEIKTVEINGKYDPYFDSKPVFKQKLKIEAR